jgi:hypothetical protein
VTSSGGLPGGPRRDGLRRALDVVRSFARSAAGDVLSHVPDTGDTTTGRAVDDFVEQAADSLRALDEAVIATMRRIDAADGMPLDAGSAAPERQERQAYRPGSRGEP